MLIILLRYEAGANIYIFLIFSYRKFDLHFWVIFYRDHNGLLSFHKT